MAIVQLKARDKVDAIKSKADLAKFVRDLRADLKLDPDRWENATLDDFLEAMAAWIDDMDGYYRNRGESVKEQPTWKVIGDILMGAKVYS
jgi:hypothetical protein